MSGRFPGPGQGNFVPQNNFGHGDFPHPPPGGRQNFMPPSMNAQGRPFLPSSGNGVGFPPAPERRPLLGADGTVAELPPLLVGGPPPNSEHLHGFAGPGHRGPPHIPGAPMSSLPSSAPPMAGPPPNRPPPPAMSVGAATSAVPTASPAAPEQAAATTQFKNVSPSPVSFSNDGSFMEKFRAMQQQQQQQQPPTQPSTAPRASDQKEDVPGVPAKATAAPAAASGFVNDGSFLERFRSLQKAPGKESASITVSGQQPVEPASAPSASAASASGGVSSKKPAAPLKGAMKNKIAMMVAQSKKLQKGDKVIASADMFNEDDLDGEEMEGETMGMSSAAVAAAMRAAEQLAVYVAEGGAPVETMAIRQNENNQSFWWLYQPVSTPYRHYKAKVEELSHGSVKPQHPSLVLQGRSVDAGDSSQPQASFEPAAKKRKSRWGVQGDDADARVAAPPVVPAAYPARADSIQDSMAALAGYAPPHRSLGTSTQVHSSAAAATSFSSKAAPPPSSYGATPSRRYGDGGGGQGDRPSTKQAIAIIAARVAASQKALTERVKTEKQAEEDAYNSLYPQGPESTDNTALQQQLEEQRYLNDLVERYKQVAQASAPPKPPPDSRGKKRHNKHEYDSDEDTEGGTWEHKKRRQEMEKTADKAWTLTFAGRGKHHIADFMPKEEMDKFFAKVKAIKEGAPFDFSDYAEHRIKAENLGYQLLKSAGWEEGQGLGSLGQGIKNPINKGKTSFEQSGVGAEQPGDVQADDDEFDLYRKRMMLAYRFRPNPLNNPRRAYY